MRTVIRLLVGTFLTGFTLLYTCQSPFTGGVEPLPITKHQIIAELDPLEHYIKVTDTIEVVVEKEGPPKSGLFYFALHPALELKYLILQDCETARAIKARPGKSGGLRQYNLYLPLSRSQTSDKFTLVCFYEGRIYHKPEEESLLSGIISEQGVYLAHSSGWYPLTHLSPMILFEVTTITPQGLEVVGQDELKKRVVVDDKVKTRWASQIPFKGWNLVAGKWLISEERFNNIRIATYFSPDCQPLAEMYIKATKRFLTVFPQFLTPYPYKSFSIVEDFFNTGYRMPAYTLLSKDVIVGQHINEDGLGHEIMHSWWGNYVNLDESRSNWCEGLTTYCSNYYLEEKKTLTDALNYRRINCVNFSTAINESNDYPVRQFVGEAEINNEIGSGKASAIFHMLIRMIGDKAFFDGLKLVIQEKGGKKANWEDFQFAFEKTSSQKLDWFFTQWLDRRGIPDLALENVQLQSIADNKYQISFTIKQLTSIPFRLFLPVVVTTDKGKEESIVEIASLIEPKTIEVNANKVISISIDPEYHIFRRFKDKELWPCLRTTLNDSNLLVIYPSGSSIEENELYGKLAEQIAGSSGQVNPHTKIFGVGVKADNEVSQQDLNNNSLFVLGLPNINLVSTRLMTDSAFKTAKFTLMKDEFVIKGITYRLSSQAPLVSFWSPYDNKKYITLFLVDLPRWYEIDKLIRLCNFITVSQTNYDFNKLIFGLSAQPSERPEGIIFSYQWDQYVIFEDGQMVRKGNFTAPFNSLEYYFLTE